MSEHECLSFLLFLLHMSWIWELPFRRGFLHFSLIIFILLYI